MLNQMLILVWQWGKQGDWHSLGVRKKQIAKEKADFEVPMI